MTAFKRSILVFAAIITFLLSVPGVFAIGNGDISIAPTQASDPADPRTKSWFVYSFAPGTTHEDSVSVRNDSDVTRTIKLYAVDGYTTAQGGFALRNQNDTKGTVGKWLILNQPELTLTAGQETVVKFMYNVPADAEPGDYAGGIVAEDTEKIQGRGVAIVKRVGARLYHMVPGDRNERIALIGSEMKEQNDERWFEATVENTGNVSIPLMLITDITRKDGSVVATISSEAQTVLPKSRVILKTGRFKNPPIGSFVANGKVSSGDTSMAEIPTYSFKTLHNGFIFGAAGILLMVAALTMTRMKRKKPIKRKRK